MQVHGRLCTLFPRKDEGQHAAEGLLGPSDAELVAADEQGDGLRDVAQVGARQQLSQRAQRPLHGSNEPAAGRLRWATASRKISTHTG